MPRTRSCLIQLRPDDLIVTNPNHPGLVIQNEDGISYIESPDPDMWDYVAARATALADQIRSQAELFIRSAARCEDLPAADGWPQDHKP